MRPTRDRSSAGSPDREAMIALVLSELPSHDPIEAFGLDPEARQVPLGERIAKIFEQLSSNTDPPTEARGFTRPTRDRGSAGIT